MSAVLDLPRHRFSRVQFERMISADQGVSPESCLSQIIPVTDLLP